VQQIAVKPVQVNVAPPSVPRPAVVDRAIKIDSTGSTGKTAVPTPIPPAIKPADARVVQEQRERLRRLEQSDRLSGRGKKGQGSTP
jgi:hypothetical protein